jgi:hypothetical protein
MPVLRDVELLRELRAAPVPPALARRERLVALRQQALDRVEQQGLLDTRACWRVVPLEGAPGQTGWLCLDGERLQAPWLVPESGQLTAVACAVATIGAALEHEVSA